MVARGLDATASQLLTYLSAEYAAASPPRKLLISRGSDAWLWARSIAFLVTGLDVMAEQNGRDILPDQASDEAVARFGSVYAIPRLVGAASRLTVAVTGTPSAVVTIPPGSVFKWFDGTLYAALDASVTLSGGGAGEVSVEATTRGVSTTREVGDALTWVSTPAGLNDGGTVSAVDRDGADGETVGEWAQRIIERLRRAAPAGGAEQWRRWALSFQGYDGREAYVYPMLQPPASAPGLGTPGVYGCCSVVVVGPPQGDSAVNTRVVGGVSGARLTAAENYINGTANALGRPVAGEQLRPVAMASGNWTIEALAERPPTDVVLALVCNGANAFSFNFIMGVVGGGVSTATSLVVLGDFTQDPFDAGECAALVNVGTSNYRGGYYRVVLPAGTYDGGTNRTTFDLTATPLPAAPETGSLVYGSPGCWSALRAEVFRYFDGLGPGVATSNVDPTPVERYPLQDAAGRARLYRVALAAAVSNAVPGVLATSVTAPGADIEPNQKEAVTLGTLLALPA